MTDPLDPIRRALRATVANPAVEFGNPSANQTPRHLWVAAGCGFLAHLCDRETTVAADLRGTAGLDQESGGFSASSQEQGGTWA